MTSNCWSSSPSWEPDFCQTMMAGAKPVAVFGNVDRETFSQKDLMRLAGPLLPIMFALLVGFALFVWPNQMARTSAPDMTAIQSSPFQTVQRLSTAQDWTTAIATPRPAPIPGALCTRDELRTVMMAVIGTNKMWASGWWHVWDRLAGQGIPVEKSAVKTLYRGENMVRLRRHNVSLNNVLGDAAGIAVAPRGLLSQHSREILKYFLQTFEKSNENATVMVNIFFCFSGNI